MVEVELLSPADRCRLGILKHCGKIFDMLCSAPELTFRSVNLGDYLGRNLGDKPGDKLLGNFMNVCIPAHKSNDMAGRQSGQRG